MDEQINAAVSAAMNSLGLQDLDNIEMAQDLGHRIQTWADEHFGEGGRKTDLAPMSWSQCNSRWAEHPDFPKNLWLNAINRGDTRLGYGTWVDGCLALEA